METDQGCAREIPFAANEFRVTERAASFQSCGGRARHGYRADNITHNAFEIESELFETLM